MGGNIGCCCHKSRGRTKSEIINEDTKIEKLTESLKGGSIVSSKQSHESTYRSQLSIDQENLLSDINRSEYQPPQNARLDSKTSTYLLLDDDIENQNKLITVIKSKEGSP